MLVVPAANVVVLPAVGSTRSYADAVRCTSSGARIVLVAMNSPLIGSFCYSAADFRDTADRVGTAPRVLDRLVDGRVDLAHAAEAFAEPASGRSAKSEVLGFPHGVPPGSPHEGSRWSRARP